MASGIHIQAGTGVDNGSRMIGMQRMMLTNNVNTRINPVKNLFMKFDGRFEFTIGS